MILKEQKKNLLEIQQKKIQILLDQKERLEAWILKFQLMS